MITLYILPFISPLRLQVIIFRFFMSMLHAWGQDSDLDKLALNKLGLLKPTQPLTFGILSRGGHMSLLLPGWNTKYLQVGKNCYTDNLNYNCSMFYLKLKGRLI